MYSEYNLLNETREWIYENEEGKVLNTVQRFKAIHMNWLRRTCQLTITWQKHSSPWIVPNFHLLSVTPVPIHGPQIARRFLQRYSLYSA